MKARRLVCGPVAALSVLMLFCAGCGMTAHQRLVSLFALQGQPPFAEQDVRQAVLAKLPIGTSQDRIAGYLEKHGIPRVRALEGWGGTKDWGGPFYVLTRLDGFHVDYPNSLYCFVLTEASHRQILTSRRWSYHISFDLDQELKLTNVVVSSIEPCFDS